MITWRTPRIVYMVGSLAVRDLRAASPSRPRRRRAVPFAVAVSPRSRISTASRRSSASSRAKSSSESLPAAWSSSASRISRYFASFSASSSVRTTGAAAAAAGGPDRDQRAGQGDQAADPHPGDERVDDHLEGRRRAVGEVALGDPLGGRRLQAARSGPAPPGAGAGWRPRPASARASAWHCGGVPGRAADAGAEALVGRAHAALHGARCRAATAVQKSLPSPASQPDLAGRLAVEEAADRPGS